MVRTNLPIGAGRLEFATLGPFELDSGAVLAELTVGYRHDGPGPDGAPQIVVVHALTGSADAASDWWAPLIGPGRALDTDRFGVVCANLLGSCYGTTGPTSRNPATGLPYGSSFPDVSTRDQARAQWRLFDALGIDRIELVAGGSLGGMVALEIGALRPGAVRTLVPIAAPARTGPMAIAWNHIQLRLIELLGDEGLSLARQLAMTTYRSEVDFDERFGRQRQPDGTLSIVSYLTYQGRKLLDRFDRDTYRVLAGAMTLHDLGYERGGIGAALTPLGAANGRLVGVGIQDDILYGPGQVRALVADAVAAGLRADYREIHSTKGHDAFLVEWPQLDELLRDALDGEARDPVRRPVPAGRRSVPSGAGRGGDVGK
ncbi:MAG TPA: homoserine O-acetyltransferase [Candidatus Saccharimonadales bacterium]|nr:homoserine O-acetyltransferase [Candidatus Saccharimonadales bacterium]